MRVGGGGLGSSGGMALGAKLAAPDRMMIQIVGDGSFYFNVPSSVYGGVEAIQAADPLASSSTMAAGRR